MNRTCALILSAMLATAMLVAGCGKKDENKAKGDEAAAKVAPDKGAAAEATAKREHRITLEEEAAAKVADGVAGDPDTAPPTTPGDEEAKKLLAEFGPEVEAFMNGVVNAVDDAKGNCADFAAPVAKVFNESAKVLAKMKDTDKTSAAAQWKNEHANLMKSFGSKMPAIFACAQEQPELAKALEALPK